MHTPKLDYLPRGPRYPRRHKLGLIGCGGISEHHLIAAKSFGVEVVAMADINRAAAEARRDTFFPQAAVYTDHRELLARPDITVVDVATHTEIRPGQVRDALQAGKHVLSQKPFTFDLAEGRSLIALAKKRGVKLAVNQNGRWAPQFAGLLAAVRGGLLGEIYTLDMVMEWDHTWTRGSKFAGLHHLILNDFAIHWFDIAANVFAGRPAQSVFANAVKAPGQDMKIPMLANAVVNFGDGLATLGFSAYESLAPHEYLCCVGSKGTLRGAGNLCNLTQLELTTKRGTATVDLEGKWFSDGFRGTLGEFLRAIEEDREPSISASNNLRSLELCFAALASADTGRPVKPGKVQRTKGH
ncbi:MAG TPA: Gfo/Idh/MocA family oxidoreductase [Opitutaceae bacterium]|nr:Gfo/Idh/MocA family oxidoreductase [Opitutaceae bacterium]